MKKSILIPWEDARKEMFSKKELQELDIKAEKRIALRQIRELRENYKITQDTLSIKSGVPRSTISKIETGKRNVSIEKLIKIANALGKDLEIRFVDKNK
jgi:DNA-binding XRE family transcriptional regulator